MKKALLTLLTLTGFSTIAPAALYYLQANMAVGQQWGDSTLWFDQTSSGGSNPGTISNNDFDAQAFVIRTGVGASSTFSGNSLTLKSIQPQAAIINIANTLNVGQSGDIRPHSTITAVTANIGTLNVLTNYTFLAASNTQALTANIGVLTGSTTVTLNRVFSASRDMGVQTWDVTDASGFSGVMKVQTPSLTFTGLGNNFSNATLSLPDTSIISITLSGDVSFGTVTGGGFSDLLPGIYDAATLNALTNSSVFGGSSLLTVVPEPSTVAMVFGLATLGLVLSRRRRKL